MIVDRFIFQKHLEEGEEIYFIAHKHWIAITKPVSKDLFFGFFIPWLVYALFPPFFYFALAWSILGAIRLVYDIIDWYCDAWLVTSHSIIDLEWKGIFDHTSSRVEYGAIEGVSYVIRGFWGTILKFGHTQVDKIGNATPTELPQASNPKKIELKVLEFKNLFDDKKGKQDSEGIKQILADMVVRYIKENGLPKDVQEMEERGEIPENDDDDTPQKIEIENIEEEEDIAEEENETPSEEKEPLKTPFTIKKL